MKRLFLVVMAALMVFAFGPVGHTSAQSKVVRLTLIDENGSGEDGSAQITDMGDGTTKVALLMLNAPEGAVQPAHIHKGSCANLDPNPVYPLENVTAGKSTTIVKATLADLTKDKYAINVHKSAAEASVYVSCGNLPSASAVSGGKMTLEQVGAQLLDNANELLGTVKKKEADASQNAYNTYHTTFAANEDAIKAKDAATQTKLEDAMHGIRDALTAGDWTKSEQAASALVDAVKAAQTKLAEGTSGGAAMSPMADVIKKLQTAAQDVERETANKDKDGSQKAYNDFHDLFAANENDIKAKNPDAQAHLETAMHEVRDALQVGDFSKANTAAKELVMEADDAAREMSAMTGTGGDLPKGGMPTEPVALLVALVMAFTLLFVGSLARRRAIR